jgi:hypothetical protein
MPIRLRHTATKSGAANPGPKEFATYGWWVSASTG